jgi:hypothetical protein
MMNSLEQQRHLIFLLKLKMLRISNQRTASQLCFNPIFRKFIGMVDECTEKQTESIRCDLPFCAVPDDRSTIPEDWARLADDAYSIDSLRLQKLSVMSGLRAARWIAKCNLWNDALRDGRVEWIARALLSNQDSGGNSGNFSDG